LLKDFGYIYKPNAMQNYVNGNIKDAWYLSYFKPMLFWDSRNSKVIQMICEGKMLICFYFKKK
jgi:hypothetical protein